MKIKSFLSILIICSSSNANDEWLFLGSAKKKEFDYYIRPNVIKVEDNIRSAWVMFNYKNKEREVRSAVALNEYDCNNQKVRTNYLIEFSKEMGKGEAITASSPPTNLDYWKTVELGTVSEVILTTVCKYDGKTQILRS